MIPVSVLIVTRNEAHQIADCLNALKDFDDVILIDSGSMDGTQDIARALGARVVDFCWNGQYPKKRQWCLDHLDTRHEWIFFVDADEIVTQDLVDEIRALDFSRAGYFVSGRYVWNGVVLRHGVRNNKLVLLRRRCFEFPVVDDLDLPMGEMEGHYQPVLKPQCRQMTLGQIRAPLEHHAARSRQEWNLRHARYAVWERAMNRRKAWPRDPVAARQILKQVFRALPCRGAVMFVYCYIWKLGFLDGRYGFDFARARAAYYRAIGSAPLSAAGEGRGVLDKD